MKLKLLASIAGAALLSSGFSFAQTSSHDLTANSGMESWSNYSVNYSLIPPNSISLSIPDSWHGSDSMVAGFATAASLGGIQITPQMQIVQSADSHSGQSAVQLFSKNLGSIGVQPAAFSNGKIDIDIMALLTGGNFDPSQILNYIQFKGGESVGGQVASISAWMKNGDSAHVNNYGFMALALKQITSDSFVVVGQGFQSVAPTLSQYTEVVVNITYPDPNVVPDKLVAVFTSSDLSDTTSPVANNNSVLVDDVTYTMANTGIKIPLMSDNEMLVYPVPASDRVFFNLKSDQQPSDYSLRISNIEGRVISEEQLTTQINSKDVSEWAKGVYFYQLNNLKTNRQQSGKFIVK